jgi:hypothetical protein
MYDGFFRQGEDGNDLNFYMMVNITEFGLFWARVA